MKNRDRMLYVISCILLAFGMLIGLCILYVNTSFLSDIIEVEVYNKERSDFTFKLPQSEIYVRTSKFAGGIFKVFFALDSLSLDKETDYVEYQMGDQPTIWIDSQNQIFVLSPAIISIPKIMNKKLSIIPCSQNDESVDTVKPNPLKRIDINAQVYTIWINGKMIKKGDIGGGW